MPFLVSPRWLLTISDDPVEATAVSIVSEIGECLTTSADIEIVVASGAAPAVKQTVALDVADLATSLRWPVFRGYVQENVSTSDPNRVVVRCQGELSLMRDTWDDDADFTGDTDGQVVEQALSASDVTFDHDRIQDAGYVLGGIVPVVGTKRTARSAIVKELDRVLGMALVEIAGDVQRFAYSLVPDAGDIVKTFTRGVDADFWGNERRRGPIDDIKNYWNVTGVGFPCDGSGDYDEDGSCNCTIFGKAQGTNTALGSGVRVEPSGESSDVIQDQDLAEWVASRLMQWWNRNGDRITVQTGFDPEVTIGMVIGVSDPIAGVNMVSDAVDKPYLITRQEITDFDATYQCTGGGAGDTGAVSSGVEKRCNKGVSGGTPIVPGFTPPEIVGPVGPSSLPYDACADVTVTVEPPGGTYATPQTVFLTASVESVIYYTTDGSTPVVFVSPLYIVTDGIEIAVTTTLKYLVHPIGGSCETDPEAEAYVIGGGGAGGESGFSACLDLLGGAFAAEWVEDNNPWGPPGAGTLTFDGSTAVADVATPSFPYTGWGVAATVRTGVASTEKYWRIVVAGTVDTITGAMVSVSLIDDTGGSLYVQKAVAYFSGIGSTYTDQWFIDDALALGNDFGSHDIGLGFRIVLERHDWYMTVRLQNGAGDDLQTDSLLTGWDSEATGDDLAAELVVFTDDMGGQLTVSEYQLCYGRSGPVTPVEAWALASGYVGGLSSADGDNADLGDADAAAYATGSALPLPDARFRWSGTVAFSPGSGSEEDVVALLGLGPNDGTETMTFYFWMEWAGEGFSPPGPFDAYVAINSPPDYADDCCPGFDSHAGLDFLLDWNAGTCSLYLNGSGTPHLSIAYASIAGLVPKCSLSRRDDPEHFVLTDMVFTVGG